MDATATQARNARSMGGYLSDAWWDGISPKGWCCGRVGVQGDGELCYVCGWGEEVDGGRGVGGKDHVGGE